MIIFRFSSFSTNVASDLGRVPSHEGLRHLFRFHPSTGCPKICYASGGLSQNLRVVVRHAARGAHPCRGTVHHGASSQFARATGSSCQTSPVRSIACTARARRRAVATRATCQPRRCLISSYDCDSQLSGAYVTWFTTARTKVPLSQRLAPAGIDPWRMGRRPDCEERGARPAPENRRSRRRGHARSDRVAYPARGHGPCAPPYDRAS